MPVEAPPPALPPIALRRRILAWYRKNRRDLPWRRSTDPYAVWVSEVMLQQTRVDTVLPYYVRFLERFPTVADLARADEETVLALWSGLGYYGRALMLRAGAIAVMERHGGAVPDDPAFLRSLPGVGRYTAGAVASIAFARAEPVLDGNVERLLGRWLALDSPAGSRRTAGLWRVAAAIVPARSPGDWNQALMELGSTVCTPRAPACPKCPARPWCAASASGTPTAFPVPAPRRKTERARVAVAVCLHRGRILLERRSSESPLRGAWDLPAREIPDGAEPTAVLVEGLTRRHGIAPARPRVLGSVPHSILHRRLRLEAWAFPASPGAARGTESRWIEASRIDEAPVSGATRKVLRLAERVGQGRSHGGSQPLAAAGRSPSGTGSGSRGRSNA